MKPKTFPRSMKLAAIIMLLTFILALGPTALTKADGTITLATIGATYIEDFDTLANSGTSSTVPNGWHFIESGTNADTTYAAGTGSSNAGNTYSFGASDSTERAFGGLLSGSLVPTIGASFINNTGSTVNQISISYTGEQWRSGATGRSDRLDFQLSTDATALTNGTWTDHDELDFHSPNNTVTGALDGNAAANRTAISFTITGLSIADGSTFWIRWLDFNASGADDGLAIDDFSLTPIESLTPSDPLINEFVFNHTGIDTHEYVEIFGDPNTDYSAYAVLQIEGDGTGAGVIDSVHVVDTTNADGYWTTGFLNSVFENGTVTLLLVEDFSGAVSNDLDTDNDGVLDVTPWSRIVDDVAVSDGGSGDSTYSSTVLSPGFDGNSFTPGGASRIPNGVDTDSAADWTRNNFDGDGLPGFTATAQPGEAFNTPGAVNEAVPPATLLLVINEVDYDQPGTDTAEFVEIKNVGETAVSLDGVVLELVNGNSGAVIYQSIALPPVNLAAGAYFVVCGDAANVPNCDLDVSPDTNLIQNGAPDAVGLRYNDILLDAVSYEGDTGAPYTEGSGVGLEDDPGLADMGISRCPDGVDTDQNNVDFVFTSITPGAANECDDDGGDIEPIEVKIHEVQGSGASVAITDPVIVEAIVVADFQGSDQLRGFFIQEEDADADADPDTSEGIFVFCDGCATDVAVGDLVQVTGQPVDFFGMSQIDVTVSIGEVAVVSSANPLPTPVSIDLPASGSTRAETTFEHVEGMLVTFSDTLVVSEYFELARYGQLVLTADARPRQFTDANEPGVAGYAAFLEDLNSKRIILDDDNNIQNDAIEVGPDEPYFWPRPGLSITNFVRGGDSISNLTGVMHWSFAGQSGTDAWRVRPVEAFDYSFTSNNPRTEAPEDVGGSLKVASFNVLNYFTTIDSRGADSLAELDRQREKIAAAVCAMDADIVGLIEIENNGSTALLDLLNGANGINANCGPYDFIDTGVIGTDEIAVAFIYRTATVNPVGDHAILDSSVDPRFNDDKNRPALAQTFEETATGGVLTVVVNHLKSKGSACDDVGDPDIGDGQGNCNGTRTLAAEAMVDWLAADPTGSGDADFLIIGDLNAYRNEDPIDALKAGGYVDLLDTLIGPSAYTYLFDGQLGYLDHALANSNLSGQVTGVTAWNINADEIPVFDYNDDVRDPGEASFERESSALPIYEPNAYRSSDHDPVIVGLNLNGSPDCSGAMPSISTLWPPTGQFVPINVLGVTDPDGDPFTITITSIFQDEAVDAPGSGNTAPDGQGVGTSTAEVRAERVGEGGNGRYYHISFTATDSFGNSCSGVVLVSVPKSQGRNGAAIDDGPLFDSTLIP